MLRCTKSNVKQKKKSMRCIKSIEQLKKLCKKSSIYKVWLLWKKDVKWDDKTRKERYICGWFSMSLILLGVTSATFLFFPAIINFIFAIKAIVTNNIDIEE